MKLCEWSLCTASIYFEVFDIRNGMFEANSGGLFRLRCEDIENNRLVPYEDTILLLMTRLLHAPGRAGRDMTCRRQLLTQMCPAPVSAGHGSWSVTLDRVQYWRAGRCGPGVPTWILAGAARTCRSRPDAGPGAGPGAELDSGLDPHRDGRVIS